jgi:UDP-N-acetylglucosamine 4,6-dehydratase
VNREEMAKATDMGEYFKIPADTRDLNYNKFFTEGTEAVSQADEYTSHNTQRLNIEETKELLLSLSFIRQDVLNDKPEMVYEP